MGLAHGLHVTLGTRWQHAVYAVRSGLKITHESGGSTRLSDWSCPCAASASVATPPMLPTFDPP